MARPKRTEGGKKCRWADDCFKCPLKECVISVNDAPRTNVLPYESIVVRGKAEKTTAKADRAI